MKCQRALSRLPTCKSAYRMRRRGDRWRPAGAVMTRASTACAGMSDGAPAIELSASNATARKAKARLKKWAKVLDFVDGEAQNVCSGQPQTLARLQPTSR